MSELDDALNEGLEVLDDYDGKALTLTIPGRAPVTMRGTFDQVDATETEGDTRRTITTAHVLLLRSRNADLEAALIATGQTTLKKGWKVAQGTERFLVDSCASDLIAHQVVLGHDNASS